MGCLQTGQVCRKPRAKFAPTAAMPRVPIFTVVLPSFFMPV